MSDKPISMNPGKSMKLLSTSNSTNFSPRPRGIVVTTGTLVIVNEDDTTTALVDGVLATGVVHPISPKRINTTGTTATIYGIY